MQANSEKNGFKVFLSMGVNHRAIVEGMGMTDVVTNEEWHNRGLTVEHSVWLHGNVGKRRIN